ncbi:MAG: DUF63 family protein [Candidatus Micrarchaeota archaeon]
MDLISSIGQFVQQYYIEPITTGSGYNPVNTVTYAILLLVGIWAVMKLLKKMKIQLTPGLWRGLIPYVLLGGMFRACEDANLLSVFGDLHFLFITPMIYLFIFAMAISTVAFSHYTKRDIVGKTGWAVVAVLALLIAINAKNWPGFAMIVGLGLGIFATVYLIAKQLKQKWLTSGYNSLPVLAHTFDACSSVISIMVIGGYTEQHVVPNLIFSSIPFYFFIPLKVALSLLAVYVIQKEVEDPRWRWMLMLAVFVLGMGPGTRNTLTALLGTNMM